MHGEALHDRRYRVLVKGTGLFARKFKSQSRVPIGRHRLINPDIECYVARPSPVMSLELRRLLTGYVRMSHLLKMRHLQCSRCILWRPFRCRYAYLEANDHDTPHLITRWIMCKAGPC